MVQESQNGHCPGEEEGPAETRSWVRVGQALRTARLAQGVSVAQLAQGLHIGQKQLTAIENGDDHLLPEPVYIKAMVRRVADRLHLDANALVKQLPASDSGSSTLISAPPQPSEPLNNQLLKGFVVVAALLGITAACFAISSRQEFFLWPQPNQRQTAKPGLDSVANPDPAAVTDPVTDPAQSPSAAQTSATGLAAKPAPEGDAEGDIELSSLKPSWVSIRDLQGRIVFEGTLDKTVSYPSTQSLEIYAGRPDLVRVSHSGTAPVPLGSIENVRWHRLNTIPKKSTQKQESPPQR